MTLCCISKLPGPSHTSATTQVLYLRDRMLGNVLELLEYSRACFPDNVAVTEKDRMLSLTYHSSDQATQIAGYMGEGVAAGDLRSVRIKVILDDI